MATTKIVRNLSPKVVQVLDELADEAGLSTEEFIRRLLAAKVGDREPKAGLFCDICDQEVFVVSRQHENATGNVAFKRRGTHAPRKYYCASCCADGSGYPSDKFEQA